MPLTSLVQGYIWPPFCVMMGPSQLLSFCYSPWHLTLLIAPSFWELYYSFITMTLIFWLSLNLSHQFFSVFTSCSLLFPYISMLPRALTMVLSSYFYCSLDDLIHINYFKYHNCAVDIFIHISGTDHTAEIQTSCLLAHSPGCPLSSKLQDF